MGLFDLFFDITQPEEKISLLDIMKIINTYHINIDQIESEFNKYQTNIILKEKFDETIVFEQVDKKQLILNISWIKLYLNNECKNYF